MGSAGSADDAVWWRVAFEEAWQAHRHGSIAVGAVLVDEHGSVVLADRNRTGESGGPAGLLFGNRLAHAEINVLAKLGHTFPTGLRLLATLQPCVLCAGACSFARVPQVVYAAVDAAWDGVEALHAASPLLRERAPTLAWADLGLWSVWAEALPLAGVLQRYGPDTRVGACYATVNPALLELAAALASDAGLTELDLHAAFERWRNRLHAVSATRPTP